MESGDDPSRTRWGDLTLDKPVLREIPFRPQVFERYSRIEKSLERDLGVLSSGSIDEKDPGRDSSPRNRQDIPPMFLLLSGSWMRRYRHSCPGRWIPIFPISLSMRPSSRYGRESGISIRHYYSLPASGRTLITH
jgi:hypothetical protein